MTKVPAEKPAPLKRLLPARAVAERYNVHLRTLARWEKAGLLPPEDFRIGDRRYWDVTTLDEADRQRAHPAQRFPKNSSDRKRTIAAAAPAKRGRAKTAVR